MSWAAKFTSGSATAPRLASPRLRSVRLWASSGLSIRATPRARSVSLLRPPGTGASRTPRRSSVLSARFILSVFSVYFFGGPRLRQRFLELIECIRSDRAPLTPDHHEPQRTIQYRQLFFRHRSCKLFGKTQARDTERCAILVLYVVLDVDFPLADEHSLWKTRESLPHLSWNDFIPFEREARVAKFLHRGDAPELTFVPFSEVRQTETRRLSS